MKKYKAVITKQVSSLMVLIPIAAARFSISCIIWAPTPFLLYSSSTNTVDT